MQNLLDVVTARFLDTPLIWLKDLASYLNVRINPVNMPDPIFKGKPDSYPTTLMPSQVKKVRLQHTHVLACTFLCKIYYIVMCKHFQFHLLLLLLIVSFLVLILLIISLLLFVIFLSFSK